VIVRLDPPIPLVTPRGRGLAHFLRDYGIEHDDYWTVVLDETGEWWTFSNREVRAQENITAGRCSISACRANGHRKTFSRARRSG
jgi:hypothetical protein